MTTNNHRSGSSGFTRRQFVVRGSALGAALFATPAFTRAALAQATPTLGGTLTIAQGNDVATFDAMKLSGLPSFGVVAQVTEQLTRIGPDGKLRPRLAESWKQSADGITWTISLRKGVKFQDGTPFDAAAVKEEVERYLKIGQGKQSLAAVARVDVVDETTINVVTDGPYAPLMHVFSYAPIQISSPAAVAKNGDAYGSPAVGAVGTGPFIFKSQKKGEEIELTANKEYWDGAPYVDSVVVKPIPESGSRVIALESGDVDFVFEMPPKDAQRLEQDPKYQIIRQKSERIPYLTMNNTWGPFKDKRVRQAVFYAIDRKAIVDRILLGNATVAESPVPSLAFGFAPVLKYTYDPDKAKQLLADAGHGDGFDVTFTYPPGRFTNDTEVVAAIQLYLEAVGIHVKIQQMEFAAWQAASRLPVDQNKFQMTIQSRGAATLDADKALSDFTKKAWTPNGLNMAFYDNPEVDKLVEQQRTTVDEQERLKLLRQIQELIADDAPDVYLYEITQIFGARAGVHGVEVDPTQVLLPLNRAFVSG